MIPIAVSIPVQFRPKQDALRPVYTAGALSLCLTHSCNISCTHCSVEALNGRKPQVMNIDIARQALQFFVGTSRRKHFRVVFFGGEPMLAPISWFEQFHALLKDYPDTAFSIGMQTNGTIMTDRHIDLIRRSGMQISISLDGRPEVNDIIRQRGEKVVRNIQRLVEAGMPPKVIVVISPGNHDKIPETLAFLRGLGISGVRFNTLFEVGRATSGDALTDEQLLNSKVALVDEVLCDNAAKIQDVMTLRMLSDYARYQLHHTHDTRDDCSGYTCHAGFTYFSVDPIGDVFPCSDMTFTMHDFRLGNVLDGGFDPTHVSSTLSRFHAKGEWWKRCKDCAAKTICDFGCPALTPTAPVTGNPHCGVTRKLWQHLEQRHNEILHWFHRASDKDETVKL